MSPCEWHDDAATAAFMRGAARGLTAWADEVLDESQLVVPVAEGRGGGYLRDTGEVDVDEQKLEATVSYSSPPRRDSGRDPASAPVAVLVHENLHARHAGGKTAKYLERPLRATVQRGLQKVAYEIAREL